MTSSVIRVTGSTRTGRRDAWAVTVSAQRDKAGTRRRAGAASPSRISESGAEARPGGPADSGTVTLARRQRPSRRDGHCASLSLRALKIASLSLTESEQLALAAS